METDMCMTNLYRATVLGMTVGLLACGAQAAKLDSSKWTVMEVATGRNVAQGVSDNNLETSWTGTESGGLTIDLGRETMVHRVYLTPGADTNALIRSVRIAFMTKPDETNAPARRYIRPTCEAWKVMEERWKAVRGGTNDFLPVQGGSYFYKEGPPKTDVNLKFNPLKARYLRIEGPTRIAELEIYGSSEPAAFEKKDAVVLAAGAPELLRVAAEDLRYYVGELTGRPLPIISPEQESEYPGTLYRVEDLKSLAPDYSTMLENLKSGRLPTGGPLPETVVSLHTMRLPDGVNVEREGRAVVFRAWPYRNVFYSVGEFLRRQGVVWTYPDDHGDYVPAGKGIDLDILPLKYRPSADLRNAMFSVNDGHLYPYTDAFLFWARSGYGTSGQLLDGFLNQQNEVPPIPAAQMSKKEHVRPEHVEGGFDAFPHNFSGVLPDRILEQHSDWCGMTEDGKRLPPDKGGPSTFCLSSTGAIQFVADKIVDWAGSNRSSHAKFNLLPMDGCRYCQCQDCKELYQPYERPDLPWVPGMNYMVSDAYYHFVAEVAKRVAVKAPQARVGFLAYADVLSPPRKIGKLPDNVWGVICQYGSRNLPMSSPANAAMRQCMETWAQKCAHLGTYEYALIEGEWMELPMPLPSITAIADRSKFLQGAGAWNGGSQSYLNCLPHNPWNHYAYARMMWDVSLEPTKIKDEFFKAYYAEAAVPMREYYDIFETHLLKNNIDLQNFGYDQGPNPDAFPPEIVAAMGKSLDQAQQAAKSWVVKQRVATARKDFDWSVPASLRRSMDKAVALKYGKKEYVCGRRKGGITLDGKLDEDAWKTAPTSGGFIKPKTFETAPAEAQSEFRMLWDDDTLYIAGKCVNPGIAALKETDAIWGKDTDNLEIHLVPEKTYTAAYYQFALSVFNRSFGPMRCFHDQWHKDTEWKGEIKTAVQRGDGVWTCEIAVPLKVLKEGAPKAGDWWRVNIARNYPGGASCWSPLQVGAWMLYRDFNFVTFEGN
jgi:hypothetical protein